MLAAAPVTVLGADAAAGGDRDLRVAGPEYRDVLALAARITDRLRVPPRGPDRGSRTFGGPPARVPYRGRSVEIDLDRSLERILRSGVARNEDLVVVERLRRLREVVLAVDVSGSMRGERVRAAVATVAALAAELHRDRVAVVAFGSDGVVISDLTRPSAVNRLVRDLLAVRVRGLTNIGLGIDIGAGMLGRSVGVDRRIILLSDMIHNAGPDPRPAAARAPRVDVLLDATGEHDAVLAGEVAREGHGIAAVVRSRRDVARALTRLFSR